MAEKYSYTIGRRKTSVATIRLYSTSGENIYNEKPLKNVYSHDYELVKLFAPFKVADLSEKEYYFTAKVVGGGKESQLEAMRLGLARAIVKLFPEKKKALKDQGLLTRDSRMVERKKAGLRKARKSEQYSKR
jgi:small subunit ribosomal protein S9